MIEPTYAEVCREELLKKMQMCGRFLHHRRKGKQSQENILRILLRAETLSQRGLQEKLCIQAGSLSEILTKMEGQQLIVRSKDPSDRRKTMLTLTPSGEKIARVQAQASLEEGCKLFDCLNQAEQAQLQSILTKLLSSWKEDPVEQEGTKA